MNFPILRIWEEIGPMSATLTARVGFSRDDGEEPAIADANGDLLGQTDGRDACGCWTLFEIAKTPDRPRKRAHHAGEPQRLCVRQPLAGGALADPFLNCRD
jgi:hypothetical protein